MKKIQKTKKGFTLVEMVLVIAIIVILAAVLALSIGTYIGRAKKAASSVSMHNWSISKATSEIDAQL
jgi:type IV pilus assembly protein PilA